jgi:hypothetical protein
MSVNAQVDVVFTVQAPSTYTDVQIKGDMNSWTPENMYDDATHGDVQAGDNIWSATISCPVDATYEWGATNDPSGVDTWLGGKPKLHVLANGTLQMLPKVSPLDVVYGVVGATKPPHVVVLLTVQGTDAVAGMNAKGGYDADWSGKHLMYDDATNGDVTSGDGIYSALVEIELPSITTPFEWGVEDAPGGTWIGGNVTFSVSPTGVITPILTTDQATTPKDLTFGASAAGVYTSASTLAESKISVYPNPTTDFIVVTDAAPIKQVSVMNMLGQNIKVDDNINATTYKMNLSHLSKGFYVVSVLNTNGQVTLKQVIKK